MRELAGVQAWIGRRWWGVVAAVVPAVLGVGVVWGGGPAGAVPGDPWYFEAMGIPAAHEQTRGAGVTVAVIEPSFNASVPDLQGADVVAAANTCQVLWGGREGEWRFGEGPRTDPQAFALEPVGSDGDGAHGAQVVSMLVGTGRGNGPGGSGAKGIAPDVSVRVYVVGNERSCLHRGASTGAAIVQAVMDGADIISISMITGSGLALSGSEVPDRDVQYALDHGVPVVWAAGNVEGRLLVSHSSRVPGVVWAGGVNPEAGQFGNFGPWLTVVAPAVDIPAGGYANAAGEWDSTQVWDGTSLAAPLVAGVMALVMAKYPQATGNQVIQHLVRTTTRGGELVHEEEFGFGIPHVSRLLAEDPTRWQDVNPLTLVDKASELPGVQSNAQALATAAEALGAGSEPTAPSGQQDRDGAGGQGDRSGGDSGGVVPGGGGGGWVPVVLWVVAGVGTVGVLTLAVVLALLVRRRSQRAPKPALAPVEASGGPGG